MNFRAEFDIGPLHVGGNAPVLIIAEAGVAHFGDMGLARQLVEMSAAAGADVFKTQFFDVDALIAASESAWRNRLRPRNLTLDQAFVLKEMVEAQGMLFMATAHDPSRIDWLRQLAVPAIKIGSGERGNSAFLAELAALGKPMILSTGMYRAEDVQRALAACADGGCHELALLHCITSYPTPDEDVNLAAMDTLRELFPGPVGYSDHTVDFLACYAAVARGAKIIEKHITVLRDIPDAQDWKVSAGPDNFPQFVAEIRRIETMLGHAGKTPAPCEAQAEHWALKSIVAARDLELGAVLTPEDLCVKRPGDGLPPYRMNEVLGRRLKRRLMTDEMLALVDVE